MRRKSVALTEYAIELTDALLAPHGVTVASPRDSARRGSHVDLHQAVAQREPVQPADDDHRTGGRRRRQRRMRVVAFAEVGQEGGDHALRNLVDRGDMALGQW